MNTCIYVFAKCVCVCVLLNSKYAVGIGIANTAMFCSAPPCGIIGSIYIAQHIKSDSKSFYAYVRSKQNVRDKVGPLEDNAGIKITQGCLMTEELNIYFNSVFTREDTSSLPVPETKFNGSEEERLGQLIVTPEVVASKINNMKEN